MYAVAGLSVIDDPAVSKRSRNTASSSGRSDNWAIARLDSTSLTMRSSAAVTRPSSTSRESRSSATIRGLPPSRSRHRCSWRSVSSVSASASAAVTPLRYPIHPLRRLSAGAGHGQVADPDRGDHHVDGQDVEAVRADLRRVDTLSLAVDVPGVPEGFDTTARERDAVEIGRAHV